MNFAVRAMKKAVHFTDNLLFRVFEMLFGLLLIFAAVCAIVATPAKPKLSEVFVGDGTLRVGGKIE